MCLHVGHKNLGDAGTRPMGRGHGAPLRNMLLPHKCYHIKFGGSIQVKPFGCR